MPLLVCPVCGAETIVSGTRGVEKCTFCGVEMPLTSRTNLLESVFNSATRARIAFDFDRAEELYQAHLKHFPADEDALFGMLMLPLRGGFSSRGRWFCSALLSIIIGGFTTGT